MKKKTVTVKPQVRKTRRGKKQDLRRELETLLNRTCSENESDTPDFILAEFLLSSLAVFNRVIRERDLWRSYDTVCPRLLNDSAR